MGNEILAGFMASRAEKQGDRQLDQSQERLETYGKQIKVLEQQNERQQRVADDLDMNEALFDLDTTKSWKGVKEAFPRVKGLTNGNMSLESVGDEDIYVEGVEPYQLGEGEQHTIRRDDNGNVYISGRQVSPDFLGKTREVLGLQELKDNDRAPDISSVRKLTDNVIGDDDNTYTKATYVTPESIIEGVGPISGYQAYKFGQLAKLKKNTTKAPKYDDQQALADMEYFESKEVKLDSPEAIDPQTGKPFGASAYQLKNLMEYKQGVAKRNAGRRLTATTDGVKEPNAREKIVSAVDSKELVVEVLQEMLPEIARLKQDEATMGNTYKDDQDIKGRITTIATLKDLQTKVNDSNWLQENMQQGDLQRVRESLPENFNTMTADQQRDVLNQISLNTELSTGMRSILKVISGVAVQDSEREGFVQDMFGGDITKVNPKVLAASLGGMIESNYKTAQEGIKTISPTEFPGTKAELALSLARANGWSPSKDSEVSPTGEPITEFGAGKNVADVGSDAQVKKARTEMERKIKNASNKVSGITDATLFSPVSDLLTAIPADVGSYITKDEALNKTYKLLNPEYDPTKQTRRNRVTTQMKLNAVIKEVAEQPEFDKFRDALLTDEEIAIYAGSGAFSDDPTPEGARKWLDANSPEALGGDYSEAMLPYVKGAMQLAGSGGVLLNGKRIYKSAKTLAGKVVDKVTDGKTKTKLKNLRENIETWEGQKITKRGEMYEALKKAQGAKGGKTKASANIELEMEKAEKFFSEIIESLRKEEISIETARTMWNGKITDIGLGIGGLYTFDKMLFDD